MALDTAFMVEIFPDMARAALTTIQVSLAALAIALPVAILGAWVRLRGAWWLQAPVVAFVVFTRGVPPLVQISGVYFLLPQVGLMVDEFGTGVIALAIIGAGYGIEIVRGSIASLPLGQAETARSLGLSDWQCFRLVLVPQALKAMLPPLANEVANLIKASALLSVISVNEITKVGNDLIFERFYVIEVLIQVAVFYLIIVSAMMSVAKRLERRAK
jgi:polar amino acid transport system permease protein